MLALALKIALACLGIWITARAFEVSLQWGLLLIVLPICFGLAGTSPGGAAVLIAAQLALARRRPSRILMPVSAFVVVFVALLVTNRVTFGLWTWR